jgi:hypothetical protein
MCKNYEDNTGRRDIWIVDKSTYPLLPEGCAYMDVGSSAPTVGVLGSAGAVAEKVGMRLSKLSSLF